jgi:hypothetical protein
MHKSRSNRRKNQARKAQVARRQAKIPLGQQREVAEARAREHHDRYPTAPIYCHADGTPYTGDQPACYSRVMW